MRRIVCSLVLLLLLAGCGQAQDASLAEGRALYDANCASCHGIKGEGQANWQQPLPNGSYLAPPHDATGHTWHHPDGLLLQIIAEGGGTPGSTMPAFGDTLTPDQQRAILAYIKSFWPADIRAAQADLSRRYDQAQP